MGGSMVGASPSPQSPASQSSSSRRKPGPSASAEASEAQSEISGDFPPGAQLCGKCNTQALVLLDGCQTCLNCGYSKCG
jgi:hypothetical protein